MAIRSGVGYSKNQNASQAGYEAVQTALRSAGTEHPDFVIVFASPAVDQEEVVKGIRDATGEAAMIGCSSAGEIANASAGSGGVAVMVIQADNITFHTGLGKGVSNGAREAGKAVAEEIQGKAREAGAELKAFVMLPDVLTGNGADAVRGVQDVLGHHFPLVGGASGDDFAFKKTYEYRDGEVVSGAIAGVGLTGDFAMGIGVAHGWMPIGSPMKVTRSEGAVVHELDGKPAISIYEDYFGQSSEEISREPLARMAYTYPLGLKVEGYEDEYMLRDAITVDENGALTCAAEIPEGSTVRLMIGSKDEAVQAAKNAAGKLMQDFEKAGASPKFVLMFNCIARKKLFAGEADDELAAVAETIGKDVPVLGFYTYGEQAPLGGEIHDKEKIEPHFYNETVALLGIGE